MKRNRKTGVFSAVRAAAAGHKLLSAGTLLCAAAAVLAHPKELYPAIARAQKNADRLREALEGAGLSVYGGENSPYLWAKTPGKMTSMAFFSQLLSQLGLAATPGSGFGEGGEGFVRFSALGREADVREACARLRGIAFS